MISLNAVDLVQDAKNVVVLWRPILTTLRNFKSVESGGRGRLDRGAGAVAFVGRAVVEAPGVGGDHGLGAEVLFFCAAF